jgi:hypothetical protein
VGWMLHILVFFLTHYPFFNAFSDMLNLDTLEKENSKHFNY